MLIRLWITINVIVLITFNFNGLIIGHTDYTDTTDFDDGTVID